jgi:zinc metalloprotease ZmpA
VQGIGKDGESRLKVEVDALTGAVLSTEEQVAHGTGNSGYNGPNPIPLNTTPSSSSGACAPLKAPCFGRQDPTITGLKCSDSSSNPSNINNSPLVRSRRCCHGGPAR